MGFFSKLLSWFLFINLFWYLIGSFVAFDLNPANWWLINATFGRVLLIVIEFFFISAALKMTDDV